MRQVALLKTAYRVTTHYPRLWLLGLFLGSWFTFMLMSLPGSKEYEGGPMPFHFTWPIHGVYSDSSMVMLLILFLSGLIVTNWAKVFLVLNLQSIFKMRRLTDLKKELEARRHFGDRRRGEGGLASDEFRHSAPPLETMFSESRKYLVRVIVISLFTTGVMAMALSVLAIPFLSFARNAEAQSFVGLCAALIFIFLTVLISLIGVFGSFFAILLTESAHAAINVAIDLVISRWKVILTTVSLLAVTYAVAFFVGWYALRFLGVWFMGNTDSASGLHLANILSNMVLWVWLGVLNVFFYSGLFALFIFLVRPSITEEAASLAPQVTGVSVP